MRRGMHLLNFLLLGVLAGPLQAKRESPAPAPSVTFRGVTYAAPHFARVEDTLRHGGVVRATDSRNGKLLTERILYRIRLNPQMEPDAQEEYITQMSVDSLADTLRVRTERGRAFGMKLLRP